jgi:hypothetical protein
MLLIRLLVDALRVSRFDDLAFSIFPTEVPVYGGSTTRRSRFFQQRFPSMTNEVRRMRFDDSAFSIFQQGFSSMKKEDDCISTGRTRYPHD